MARQGKLMLARCLRRHMAGRPLHTPHSTLPLHSSKLRPGFRFTLLQPLATILGFPAESEGSLRGCADAGCHGTNKHSLGRRGFVAHSFGAKTRGIRPRPAGQNSYMERSGPARPSIIERFGHSSQPLCISRLHWHLHKI
jgi:hypothetical protein